MNDEMRPAGEPPRQMPGGPRPRTPRRKVPPLAWREGTCLIYGCTEDVRKGARWCEPHGGDPRAK